AFDGKHDATQSQRVWRRDLRFARDQRWIAKLRQLKPPVPIWGLHHHDVDLDAFHPVDAVHPLALDRRLAFPRHAEGGEKSDSGGEVGDDDADMVHSLDRHVPSIAGNSGGRVRRSRLTVLATWTWFATTAGDAGDDALLHGASSQRDRNEIECCPKTG